VAKTLIDEERSVEKEREKADRLKRKRPSGSSPGDGTITGTAVSPAIHPSRKREVTNFPQETPPLSGEPKQPPTEPLPPGESGSGEEKQVGKRTQKTLFDGF
jgi:hypothetical protein